MQCFETPKEIKGVIFLFLSLGTEHCCDMVDGGLEKLHFHMLNKPGFKHKICKDIRVAPKTGLQKVARSLRSHYCQKLVLLIRSIRLRPDVKSYHPKVQKSGQGSPDGKLTIKDSQLYTSHNVGLQFAPRE